MDRSNSWQEIIKDFPTDKQVCDWSKNFVEECKRRNCYGVACFSAPQSETSYSAIAADLFNGMFLLKSLVQEFAEVSGISATKYAASIMWYLAQVETGIIDEDKKIFYESSIGRALEFATQIFGQVVNNSMQNDFLRDTPIDNQITRK